MLMKPKSEPPSSLFKYVYAEPWPRTSFLMPKIQTHRGYWTEGLVENTRESITQAFTLGSTMVEMDVRCTADHVPVLFHDKTTTRIAQLCGAQGFDEKIEDMTCDELQSRLPKITRLEEILLGINPNQFLNIEIKSNHPVNDVTERKVVELIFKLQKQKQIMFSSFNPISIWKLSNLAPLIPRALLVSDVSDPENIWILKKMLLLPFLKVHALHVEQEMANPEFIRFWRARGMMVNAWTVNEIKKAHELWAFGCSSVISDQIILS